MPRHLLIAFVLCWTLYVPSLLCAQVELYVSRTGNDAWSGRLETVVTDKADGPFATLSRARDEIRTIKLQGLPAKGVTVWIGAGLYSLPDGLQLGAQDAGTRQKPIRYRARGGERVVLSGGRFVDQFVPVTEEKVLARIDASARSSVLQADLAALGITDFGSVAAQNKRLELFFHNEPMTLARWPNEGFVTIEELTGGERFKSHGIPGSKEGKFALAGERMGRWKAENDLWLHGYWFWDWSDQFQEVASLDVAQREFSLTPPYHHYGYRKGQRFYVLNALAELDRPGEWYLDRQAGRFYFWPPKKITRGSVALSMTTTLLKLDNCPDVSFEGLTFEVTRSTAVNVSGGLRNAIVGCTVRNTGGKGVAIAGVESGVIGCDIYRTGEAGVTLSGGDRKALTPAGLYAENNDIYEFGRIYRTYRPAVGVYGVGNRVSHNQIHNGPHAGILLGGNDHLIELNQIYDVCYETGDVGAFYTGRDWTAQGNVIRHNYFHHIQGPGLHGAMAVYLDDAASGFHVFGNVFYKAGRAAFVGGGRNNLIENNIFVDCKPSVHVDDRGLGWMHATVAEGGTMRKRLAAVPYQQPPWSTRYPKLVSILDNNPAAPVGNRIVRNISVGGTWAAIYPKAKPLVKLEANLIDADPRFIDRDNEDFRLQDDSPAYKLGFQRIATEKIGLYEDARRASWPVAQGRRE